MDIEIKEAYDSLEDVKTLFLEYTNSLGIDLTFQNFEKEFAELPGKYAKPMGRLYVIYVDGCAAGCIALRPFDLGRCEMKRLYVRPDYRGYKLGLRLAMCLIEEAKSMGYEKMLLDTLGNMYAARKLYQGLGFKEIEAYYHNPVQNVYYLALELK